MKEAYDCGCGCPNCGTLIKGLLGILRPLAFLPLQDSVVMRAARDDAKIFFETDERKGR